MQKFWGQFISKREAESPQHLHIHHQAGELEIWQVIDAVIDQVEVRQCEMVVERVEEDFRAKVIDKNQETCQDETCDGGLRPPLPSCRDRRLERNVPVNLRYLPRQIRNRGSDEYKPEHTGVPESQRTQYECGRRDQKETKSCGKQPPLKGSEFRLRNKFAQQMSATLHNNPDDPDRNAETSEPLDRVRMPRMEIAVGTHQREKAVRQQRRPAELEVQNDRQPKSRDCDADTLPYIPVGFDNHGVRRRKHRFAQSGHDRIKRKMGDGSAHRPQINRRRLSLLRSSSSFR